MNLIIDIGNSRAKAAVFDGEEIVEQIATDNSTLKGLAELAQRHPIGNGIMSTTIDLCEEAKQALKSLPFSMIEFTSATSMPIKVHYDTPLTLGTDRLAAVVGAQSVKPGSDVLVIDAGTCITYELLDHDGNYWGGNISPGLQMRLNAVHEHTSRLPLICSDGECPEIGHSTETAIRSGIERGIQYEIEGYIRHFRKRYPRLEVILTGGDNFEFDQEIKDIISTDSNLVEKGLNRILQHNVQ